MSQVGRPIKSLEAPRPLKSLSRPMLQSTSYEVQSIEELITLTENVAGALALGQSNADSMTILLANLRVHGPQLEVVSKDTLDRAFVTFRNASQDERLTIIARMNLLELIELRAKSWQISDGLNTYYKHKATDVQPDITAMIDLTMLGTSPPTGLNPAVPMLSPGELLRNSGKFTKPTKIPGKNYSKDEVVIRNADSGKVMGIKGRRVHMIEELSETIISFQRVNPGAKERLVQITGPTEDKIIYAKQLIEETIRRNASPVRLDAPQGGGSCSSLASSASDETAAAAASATAAAMAANRSGPMMSASNIGGNFGGAPSTGGHMLSNNNNGGTGLSLKMPRTAGAVGQQPLLHSLSTNDASLGEYKYTVGVGNHSVKITGDCFELVRISKLVLDDYFSSSDFLASVEAGAAYDSAVTTPTTPSVMIPSAHQLNSASPFADSGIGLNYMGQSGRSLGMSSTMNNNHNTEVDDDVFIIENDEPIVPTPSLASSTPINGLTRSRRSHFSRKDSTPEFNGTAANANSSLSSSTGNASSSSLTPLSPNDSARSSAIAANSQRIVHEYERMIYYAKSPHSWALPANWAKICERFPTITRNKDVDDQKNRFDADKHMTEVKSNRFANVTNRITNADEDSSASPDPE